MYILINFNLFCICILLQNFIKNTYSQLIKKFYYYFTI